MSVRLVAGAAGTGSVVAVREVTDPAYCCRRRRGGLRRLRCRLLLDIRAWPVRSNTMTRMVVARKLGHLWPSRTINPTNYLKNQYIKDPHQRCDFPNCRAC